MKKKVLVLGALLTTLCIILLSFINSEQEVTNQTDELAVKSAPIYEPATVIPDNRPITQFVHDIGPRLNPIKKTDLDQANSFTDFIGSEHADEIAAYQSLSVILLDGIEETDIRETGNTGEFTDAQKALIKSLPYSSNLVIWANYQKKNKVTGQLIDELWTPYLTVVPENQANYTKGKEELIHYLKEGSKAARIDIKENILRPAKLHFTVTKMGAVEHVKLERSSGYPAIDKVMIELIQNAPHKWSAATNAQGEAVDQELVISFGQLGC